MVARGHGHLSIETSDARCGLAGSALTLSECGALAPRKQERARTDLQPLSFVFYTQVARGRRPGDRLERERSKRKVRTSWAGHWVTPRRSDPTPAPQRTNRRWPRRRGSNLVALAQVRVKRRGKSPPRWWRHHRHGKRRPMQGQIGRHLSAFFGESATGWPGRGLRVGRLRSEATRIPEK